MDDEPKSAAELKEIRLNRKLAQDAEGNPAGEGSRRPRQASGTQSQS
jgi:hypothetical protein